MRLRTIASALTIALASAAAHAQSGVYAMFTAQEFHQEGIYANPSTDAGGNHGNIDSPFLMGASYGAYYDVTHLPNLFFIKGGPLKTGPVVVGIDGRGETLRDSEYGSTLNRQDGLFSLRVALKKPLKGLAPYVQGGFGIGHTKVPFALHYSNNLAYLFTIGVDHKVWKQIDWRVEGGAGFLGSYRPGNAANGSNYLVNASTGLVFRIGEREKK